MPYEVVLADSHGISRAPCYSGIEFFFEIFGYKAFTFYGIIFQLLHLISIDVESLFFQDINVSYLPHDPSKNKFLKV